MDRVKKLKELLVTSPQDSFLQHALALEYVKLGEDADAKSIFIALLQNDPGYVGSYYHLGKLLERTGDTDMAVSWYKKGMEAARKAGDNHAYGELRGAHEELTF